MTSVDLSNFNWLQTKTGVFQTKLPRPHSRPVVLNIFEKSTKTSYRFRFLTMKSRHEEFEITRVCSGPRSNFGLRLNQPHPSQTLRHKGIPGPLRPLRLRRPDWCVPHRSSISLRQLPDVSRCYKRGPNVLTHMGHLSLPRLSRQPYFSWEWRRNQNESLLEQIR